jgi:hypothetical protein
MSDELALYLVCNYKGQYYRAKDINGGGTPWVDSLGKAKVFTSLKTARAALTRRYNLRPEEGGHILSVCISGYIRLDDNALESKYRKKKLKQLNKRLDYLKERIVCINKSRTKSITDEELLLQQINALEMEKISYE